MPTGRRHGKWQVESGKWKVASDVGGGKWNETLLLLQYYSIPTSGNNSSEHCFHVHLFTLQCSSYIFVYLHICISIHIKLTNSVLNMFDVHMMHLTTLHVCMIACTISTIQSWHCLPYSLLYLSVRCADWEESGRVPGRIARRNHSIQFYHSNSMHTYLYMYTL